MSFLIELRPVIDTRLCGWVAVIVDDRNRCGTGETPQAAVADLFDRVATGAVNTLGLQFAGIDPVTLAEREKVAP